MPIPIEPYRLRVSEAGLPGARRGARQQAQALDYGPVQQGLGNLAQGVGQLQSDIDKAQHEQDTAAVEEAYASVSNAKQSLLHDPQNGFVTTKVGKAALSDRDSAISYFDALTKRVSGGLNERQRLRFQHVLGTERRGFVDTVDLHVAEQAGELAKQAHNGALDAAASDAVGAALRGEFDQVHGAISMGVGAIDARAEAQGWDASFAEAQRKDFVTKAHVAVLNELVGTRPAYAREYLEANRSAMDETLVAGSQIEKRIEAAGIRDDARSIADRVWAEAKGDPARAMDLLREQNVASTPLFDEAVQRVQRRGDEVAQARRQADTPRLGRLEQRLMLGGVFTAADDDYVTLSDEGKGNALRMIRAERRARSVQSAGQNQIDRGAEADFRAVAANFPDEAAELDVADRYADATARQRNLILERQGKLRKTLVGDRGVPLRSFLAQAKEMAQRFRYSDDKTDSFLIYMSNAYSEWGEDPRNSGAKAPPPDAVKKMMGDALLYGQQDNWWGSNKQAWEAARRREPFTTAGFEEENARLSEAIGAAPVAGPAVAARGTLQFLGADGKTYNAPDNAEIRDWLAKNPKTRVVVRLAGGEPGTVPADRLDDFLRAYPGSLIQSSRAPRRTVNGEIRVWNGSAWVKE